MSNLKISQVKSQFGKLLEEMESDGHVQGPVVFNFLAKPGFTNDHFFILRRVIRDRCNAIDRLESRSQILITNSGDSDVGEKGFELVLEVRENSRNFSLEEIASVLNRYLHDEHGETGKTTWAVRGPVKLKNGGQNENND